MDKQEIEAISQMSPEALEIYLRYQYVDSVMGLIGFALFFVLCGIAIIRITKMDD